MGKKKPASSGKKKQKKSTSDQKRTIKAIKKLARRARVPPTQVHDAEKKPRRKPRSLEEHLKEEGWE